MRIAAYSRVSTTEQADSGLGLDAQRRTVEAEAERRGWGTIGLVAEVGSGASVTRRPLLAELLDRLDAGEADALVVARLDRLARSVGDFARIMERAERRGWALVVLDLGVDTSTPAGRMLASVVAATAAYERDLIRQRTREALAAKKAQGARLGRPSRLDRGTLALIVSMREQGATLRTIAAELQAQGYPTATGNTTWTAQQVAQALRTHALDQEAGAVRAGCRNAPTLDKIKEAS